jgi:hypothetical protein
MKVNLISGLDENAALEKLVSPNQIYAWFLRGSFTKAGVETRLINGRTIITKAPPEADHTIVISAAAYNRMRKFPEYREKLRKSTSGKLVSYVNTDAVERAKYFDYIFTQVKPFRNSPDTFIYAGWGVDPEYCYPEQEERAAFLDSMVYPLNSRTRGVYETYDRVLPTLDLKIYNPVHTYNNGERVPWPEYQAILRKCHYFLCTQWGDGGLNRLEAAACGALLVVPKKLRRKRTFGSLAHSMWRTGEYLVKILSEEVDVEANRELALRHRWGDVVRRMIEVLES